MPISKDTPRNEDAAIVAASVLRPVTFRRITLMLTAFYGAYAIRNIAANDVDVAAVVGYLLAFVVMAAFALWVFHHPARLRDVWREGQPMEVCVRRTWYLAFKQSLCVVEHGDDRAFVVLSGEPAKGMRYEALTHSGWVTVVDSTERLRLGRLRTR